MTIEPSCPFLGHTDSHSTWTNERGSGHALNNSVHAVVIVAADDENDLKDRETCLTLIDKQTGTNLVHRVAGKALPGDLRGHEHFGFKDGVSQPGVFSFHKHDDNGQCLGPLAHR
jgi:deferrochelatase/peroxidase EfeB